MFSLTSILFLVSSIMLGANAQEAFEGKVFYTLGPVLGACGRICNGSFTCQGNIAVGETCSGGDAAVSQTVFNSEGDPSDPTNNPICNQFVVNIAGPISVSAQVCDFCVEPECGESDLLLSDSGEDVGSTGLWLLLNQNSP